MSAPDRISVSPDPCSPGEYVTVCYVTSGCTFPIDMTVRFPPTSITIPLSINADEVPPEGPWTICIPNVGPVPDGAWNVIVNDDSGQSADGAATVTP